MSLRTAQIDAYLKGDGGIGAAPGYKSVRSRLPEQTSLLIIVDEFSALGREGRHVIPLLARTREAGMMCVLATQGRGKFVLPFRLAGQLGIKPLEDPKPKRSKKPKKAPPGS